EDAAADPDAAAVIDCLVVGDSAAVHSQIAGVVDATALDRQTVGDRHVGDGCRDATADAEDAAGGVAADRQLVGSQPDNDQVPRDRQLTAGERDRLARQTVVKTDGVVNAKSAGDLLRLGGA